MRPALVLAGLLVALAGTARADPCEAPLPKPGATFAGVVRYVGDGDSLCVGLGSDPSTWVEVRVADFFAPELNERGGQAAKAALSRAAMGKRAVCIAQKRSYDRVVATCRIEGRSLAGLMRSSGVQEGGRR